MKPVKCYLANIFRIAVIIITLLRMYATSISVDKFLLFSSYDMREYICGMSEENKNFYCFMRRKMF